MKKKQLKNEEFTLAVNTEILNEDEMVIELTYTAVISRTESEDVLRKFNALTEELDKMYRI